MAKQNKGLGWTILAVALTNSPRARQKGNPISIVELDGIEYLRVPLIKKCRIKYRGEIITFDQNKFDQMLENHRNQVWDSPPYIRVGHRDSPGLAWFSNITNENPAGKMVQEEDWLVAYALPIDDEVKKAERGYKFASVDLHRNYSSNQMGLSFSSDDFEEVTEEETMSGNKDDDKGKSTDVTLSQEEYQELMSKGVVSQATIELEAQVKTLTEEREAMKTQRDADRKAVYFSMVSTIIEKAKARRGEDGKTALSAFVLNTTASILRFENISSDDGIIKLDRSDVGIAGYIDYMVHAVDYLLSNMPIDSVPAEGSTSHVETGPSGEKIKFGMTETDLDTFYDDEIKDYFPQAVTQ